MYKLLLQAKDQVNSTADFQEKMMLPFLRFVELYSMKGISVSGLEQLDSKQKYLFISNHRDIGLDSAFLNKVLFDARPALVVKKDQNRQRDQRDNENRFQAHRPVLVIVHLAEQVPNSWFLHGNGPITPCCSGNSRSGLFYLLSHSLVKAGAEVLPYVRKCRKPCEPSRRAIECLRNKGTGTSPDDGDSILGAGL